MAETCQPLLLLGGHSIHTLKEAALEGSERFNAVLAAIASTRSWRVSPPLVSTVITTDYEGNTLTALARVDRSARIWSLNEGRNGSRCDPVHGLVLYSPAGEEKAGVDRIDWMPAAIKLFHPLQMSIWDGEFDEMRVVDAHQDPASISLRLEHREDGSPGEAIIDRAHGVVTSFKWSVEEMVLKDLRPDYGGA